MTKQRDAAQLARDRRRAADLYLQGWLQAEIAKELGINQSTVSRDLKALHKQWLASSLMDINEAKARELAKVDRLEREYWQAWQESRGQQESSTSETVEGTGGQKRARVQVRQEDRAGDPRFLTGVQWCIERRCKILGMDAPLRQVVTGQVYTQQTAQELSDAELMAIAALGAVEHQAGEGGTDDDLASGGSEGDSAT